MSRNRWRFSKSTIAVGIFGLAVGLLAGLTALISGKPGTGPGMGVVDDWTHHHLVFSNPGTAPEALAQGRVEEWYRIVNEPRYNMQQMKRNPAQRALGPAPDFATLAARLGTPISDWWPIRRPTPPTPRPRKTLARDWSMNLGGTAATQTGTFSGTTTANVTQTVTITNTSPSNTLTLTMSGTTGTLTFSVAPSVNNTVTIGGTVYQFETAAASCSSSDRCVAISGTTTTATNLKNAIGGTCFNSGGCPGGNTNDPAVLASVSSTVVTVYNMTTGSITFTKSGTYPTLSPSGGTLTQTVTNTCSSTTTGKFIINSSTSTLASNLAAAITACNTSYPAVGVTAVQDGTTPSQVDLTADTAGTPGITLADSVGNFTWTGSSLGGGLPAASVGAGVYPAKFSFDTTTASCTDFVVYNTGVAGSGTQANVVAYDNIYSGCSGSGTVPSVYWAYNTGTGKAVTSTVLSWDGTKVAFIENPSSGAAVLRILKYVSGQGTDYSAPYDMTTSTYNYTNTYAGAGGNTAWNTTNCPLGSSCMISVAFQSPHGNLDAISSPWYDYASDTLWVGDSGGYLHKFTGVFNGTPGEVTTTWPVSSGTGPLTGPVYDSTHSLVFLGNHDGKLASVTSSGSTVTYSAQIGFPSLYVSEAPLVDPAAGKVYVFVACGPGGSAYCLGTSEVFQFPYNFNSSTTLTGQGMGSSSNGTTPLYAGAFDNAYFTSTAGSPSGHMWVCGDTSGTSAPRLYWITIASNVMNANGSGPAITDSTSTTCSPVTEFCSTTTGVACSAGADTSTSTTPHQNDYIFVSPQTQSTSPVTGCTASTGCVLSYTITTSPAATYSGAGAFPGGASGMIVDTQSTSYSGTLQLYFSNLSTGTCGISGHPGYGTGGGCAIQASQTNLSH